MCWLYLMRDRFGPYAALRRQPLPGPLAEGGVVGSVAALLLGRFPDEALAWSEFDRLASAVRASWDERRALREEDRLLRRLASHRLRRAARPSRRRAQPA